MKLEEYLEKIEECPDKYLEINGNKSHRLTADFGVYDNFPILLRGDFNKILGYLEKNGFNIIDTYKQSSNYIGHRLTNNNGISRLQLRNYPCFDSFWPEFLMKEGFNMFAYIHGPSVDKWKEVKNPFPEMAKTIKTIGDYSMENKIKLAFPEIKDGLGNDDIVFYNPSE